MRTVRTKQSPINITILGKHCALSCFYLQDYTEKHDQQNTKFVLFASFRNVRCS